jgi:hypothetical protein
VSSSIAWLDFSEAQQRGIREVLRNFEEKGTVDDLGFGTVRDAISNGLFPGTSIIQTRARYFLFIPWIFMEAQRRWPSQMLGKAADMERKLIDALRTADDTDGLIGKSAGKDLKTLPSSIYWSGLQTYGIFKLRGMTIRQYGRTASRTRVASEFEGEIVDQGSSYWADIPGSPDDFFKFESAELDLSRTEADWLAERMLSTSRADGRSNLLCEVVKKVQRGDISTRDVSAVWQLQHDESLPDSIRDLLFHAERFSLLAQGLSLLYNAMLCELLRGERVELDIGHDYPAELAEWSIEANAVELIPWCSEIDRFWECLIDLRSPAQDRTRQFIASAAQLIAQRGVDDLVGNTSLRELVRDRERVHKRAQSRFTNKGRLRAYQGEAGTSRIVFRWDLVKRLLTDISVGYAQGEV